MKLTKKQSEAYRHLMWLFGEDTRGTGKSYLYAKVCIDLAMKYPNIQISLVDVTSIPLNGISFPINENFRKIISLQVEQMKDERFDFNLSSYTLIYRGK